MNRRKRKFIITAAAMIVFMTVMAFTVYAAGNSWRPDNSEIYSTQEPELLKRATDRIGDVFKSLANFVGDVIGALLSPFVRGLGDAVFSLLAACGCSLDAVIFGRVGGSSYLNNDVAMFTYELTKGNIYGTISMFIYNILSGAFLILMICIVLYRLLALLFYGYEKKIRADLKRTLGQAVLFTAAVFIMPKAVDLLLYIRDTLLYAVLTDGIGGVNALVNQEAGALGSALNSVTNTAGSLAYELFGPAGEYSLVELYRKASMDLEGSFVNSLMYLSTNILTAYFAFVYVSAALTFAVLMVLFPMCCIIDIARGGNRLYEWFEQILGLAMIPVIDAVLLLFPITLALMNGNAGVSSYTFIQFILMMSIIPAREFVRSKLGFGSSSGLERAGLGAGLAALNLARAVTGAAVKAGKENRIRDKAAALAEGTAEKAEIARNEADAKGRKAVEKLQESIETRFAGMSDRTAAEAAGLEEDGLAKAEEEISAGGDSVTTKNMRRYQEALTTREKASRAYASLGVEKKDNLSKRNEVKRQLGDLRKEQALLPKDDLEQRDHYKAAIADKERELADLDDERSGIESRMREYDGIMKDADRALTSLEAVGGTADPDRLTRADQAISLDRYRDNPRALEDCSLEKKAELTKEYADFVKKTNRTAKAAAYAAPVALGILGGGAGAMLGARGAATGAALGFDAGTFMDNAYENIAYAGAGGSKPAITGQVPAKASVRTPGGTGRDPEAMLIDQGKEALDGYRSLAEKLDLRSSAAEPFAAARVLHSVKSGTGGRALLSGIDAGIDTAYERAGTAAYAGSTDAEREHNVRKVMAEEFRKSLTGNVEIAAAFDAAGVTGEDRKRFYNHSVRSFLEGSENYIRNISATDRAAMSDETVNRRAKEEAETLSRATYVRSGRSMSLSPYRESLNQAASMAYRKAVDRVSTQSFGGIRTQKERKEILSECIRESFAESLRGSGAFQSAFTNDRDREAACRELAGRFAKQSDEYMSKLSRNTGAYFLSGSCLDAQKKNLGISLRETPEIVKKAAVTEMIAERAEEMTRCADTAYNVSLGRLSTDRVLQSLPGEERVEALEETAKETFIRLIGSDQKVRSVVDRYEREYGLTADEIFGHMKGRFGESSRMYFEKVVSGDVDVLHRATNSYLDANGHVHGPYDAFAILDGKDEAVG